MTYLVSLDLHHNQLNGSIPLTIGNLSNIHSLDLSENFLSDSIPFTLKNLKNLTQFNVSYNNLSGAIPSIPSIQQFGFSAFFHNQGLCGTPLDDPCSATPGAHKPKLSASAIVAIVAAGLIVTGVFVIIIINMKAHGRRQEDKNVVVDSTPLASTESNVIIWKLVLFSKKLPSRYEDWEAGNKVLLDKECLIGGGSIGRVYKTTFEGGITIAVKKLETLGTIRNQEEFEHEIGRLGNLQHPNFVAFQGYYWPSSMHLSQLGTRPLRLSQLGTRPLRLSQLGTRPFSLSQPGTWPLCLSQLGTRPLRLSQLGTRPFSLSQPGTQPLSLSQLGTRPLSLSQLGTRPLMQNYTKIKPPTISRPATHINERPEPCGT
ncbi:putative LRR receptor-like serine/threonine-protein kinase [Forsythia ovata]|uniref:LRR receptor-like serine/threonine-protein kinase n=1 Tax=Forsythia ovata TaxID=205694 RepID=A0ABD1WSF6_9LAMI